MPLLVCAGTPPLQQPLTCTRAGAPQALGDVQQQQEQVQQKQHKQDLPQHAAAGVPEWPGLRAWRARGINSDLVWGDNNKPAAVPVHQLQQQQSPLLLADSLVGVALQVLGTAEPSAKAAITHAGWSAYCQGRIPLHLPEQAAQQLQQAAQQQQPSSSSSRYVRPPDRPARPQHPQLVIPKHVPSPKDSPLPLAAHMLHNLARMQQAGGSHACFVDVMLAAACHVCTRARGGSRVAALCLPGVQPHALARMRA